MSEMTQWNGEMEKAVLRVLEGMFKGALVKVEFDNAQLWNEAAAVFVTVDRSMGIAAYGVDDAPLNELRERWGWFTMVIKEQAPQLLPAKVGDFVIIYSEMRSEEELDLGLVTSEHVEDGRSLWGCSYIRATVGSITKSRTSPNHIEVTQEDFGGYHEGFLQILSKDEAKRFLDKSIRRDYRKAVRDLKWDRGRALARVDSLIEDISKFETKMVTKKALRITSDELPMECHSSLANEFR